VDAQSKIDFMSNSNGERGEREMERMIEKERERRIP
jgi:hypothetical protein